MKKFILEIEFRYDIILDDEIEYKNEIITLGVHDDINSAIENGNKNLYKLENRYKKNPNYPLSRFSKDKKLISNLAYLDTPFTFFISIRELQYKNLDKFLDTIIK